MWRCSERKRGVRAVGKRRESIREDRHEGGVSECGWLAGRAAAGGGDALYHSRSLMLTDLPAGHAHCIAPREGDVRGGVTELGGEGGSE